MAWTLMRTFLAAGGPAKEPAAQSSVSLPAPAGQKLPAVVHGRHAATVVAVMPPDEQTQFQLIVLLTHQNVLVPMKALYGSRPRVTMLPESRDTDKMPVARVAEAASIVVAAIAKAKSPVAIIAIGAIMKPQTVRAQIAPNWIAAALVRK
jgi:hypothetical protein